MNLKKCINLLVPHTPFMSLMQRHRVTNASIRFERQFDCSKCADIELSRLSHESSREKEYFAVK